MNIKRGDIYLASLEPVLGSEQGKTRPCLIVQNDVSNKYSPTTIIAPLTSSLPRKEYPTLAIVTHEESGLEKTSAVLCSQIRTISMEDRIIKKLGALKPGAMRRVDEALRISLQLN
ncbi:MAG: type II toxin-antitoxin system PemK/MazF family toxin [DPANN group archaeon]|nr:type II toxin-antitoxin system PemK/MazF family toxin [DPANN group archaeon]